MTTTPVRVHGLDGAITSGVIATRSGTYEQPATAQIVEHIESGKPVTLWQEGGDLVVIPVGSIARLIVPRRLPQRPDRPEEG